jgi:hypothetical protein
VRNNQKNFFSFLKYLAIYFLSSQKTMDTTNKVLQKAVPLILFTQAVYALWLIIQPLNVFVYDLYSIIIISAASINVFLLTVTGVGLLLKKRWSIVTYWIFVILPILLVIIRINLIHTYALIVINAVLVTYYSIKHWGVWKA